ncbi:MAG: rRNA maturation RNase YbeY [Fusobacteriaceae bacterium]|jgi:probable rRNA maturation factor|nr:rRNA maturation RNase YbeY [Fusobacteriaceae bacterium]
MDIVLDLTSDVIGFEDPARETKIREYVDFVLKREYSAEKPVYISLFLTTDAHIREINRDYRNLDQPTDVISFAYHESGDYDIGPYDTLGDIVISLDRVAEQAKTYGHREEREFFYVLTHGILHLLGYDHLEENQRERMREKEENLLQTYGYTREEEQARE